MKPPTLLPGDTIGVMAPSSYVEREDIEKSTALMEERGYKVFVHPQTYEREHQFAGNILQKTLALQGLWQREDIKAIWCAGGGNRALQLIDSINFEKMKEKPKILIGFSDITAILNAIYTHTNITTFHGPVFKNLHKHGQIDHTLVLLGGETPDYPMENARIVRKGAAEGPLVGGNLSIFQYLPNTLPEGFCDGAILFLEDCGEELNHYDRMFLHLKRSGVFDKISGLICGEFTDTKDTGRPFGLTIDDIIAEHTDGFDFPVITNAPFGHGETLYTLPVGGHAILSVEDKISLRIDDSGVSAAPNS